MWFSRVSAQSLQNHLSADMMHDALRGDVLMALAGTRRHVLLVAMILQQLVEHRDDLALRTAEAVEKEAFMLPFTNPKWISGEQPMTIPAGAAAVEHAFELDMSAALPLLAPSAGLPSGTPLRVHALALHMHTLGVAGSITVAGPGGDRCGLTIPRWDFNWQGTYDFSGATTVRPGDRIRLECHWDNSAQNQPIVDGVQQPPHDLGWGEKTSDEMCLGLLYITAD